MENKAAVEPSSSSLPHIILLCMIFVFQYYSKSKEVLTVFNPEQKKKGDKLFWYYLIALQIGKASQWSISPYSYEFLDSYHNMKEETIAKFICVSFLSSTIFGTFFVGFLNDRSNKKSPCILFGLIMCISTLTRLIQNNYALIISQIAFGIASSILFSSFENWFITLCNKHLTDKNTRDAILTNAFEKNALSDSVVAMCLNMFVSYLKNKYGVYMPFVLSCFLCIVAVIFVMGLFEDTSSNSNQDNNKMSLQSILSNSVDTFREIRLKPILLFVGLTESLLFCCLQIFIFIWTPTIKELNPKVENGQIFTLFMMAFLAGGTSFRVLYSYYNEDTMVIAKVVGLLGSIGFLMIFMKKDYNNVLNGFLCFEASIGLFYPTYSKIKQELLPKEYRGTLMLMFKIPLNIIMAYLFLSLNKTVNTKQLIIGALAIEVIVFLIQMIFFSSLNKKEIKAGEGNKSSDETDNLDKENTAEKGKKKKKTKNK